MSRRFQIVLPDPVATQLVELAQAMGDPPSTLAAQMVRAEIDRAAHEGMVRQLRRASNLVSRSGADRPQWLEPFGGGQGWRKEMWGEIVALHGRYPRHLEGLKEGWWQDAAHTEILCALAVWRAQIDDGAENPREELAFQAQLADYAAVLRQQGGGVTRAWKPGAPPDEWA